MQLKEEWNEGGDEEEESSFISRLRIVIFVTRACRTFKLYDVVIVRSDHSFFYPYAFPIDRMRRIAIIVAFPMHLYTEKAQQEGYLRHGLEVDLEFELRTQVTPSTCTSRQLTEPETLVLLERLASPEFSRWHTKEEGGFLGSDTIV